MWCHSGGPLLTRQEATEAAIECSVAVGRLHFAGRVTHGRVRCHRLADHAQDCPQQLADGVASCQHESQRHHRRLKALGRPQQQRWRQQRGHGVDAEEDGERRRPRWWSS